MGYQMGCSVGFQKGSLDNYVGAYSSAHVKQVVDYDGVAYWIDLWIFKLLSKK